MSSNNLKLNQVLLIPSKDEVTGDIYIVQAGDSLYSISRRYGLTVDELKRLNNLTSNKTKSINFEYAFYWTNINITKSK